MHPAAPVIKDLVLIGGGHAHVSVLKSFGMKPIPGVRLTLISRDTLTAYSGMLPGLIAGHYSIADAHIDLAPLSRFAAARFFRGSVIGIDPERRLIHLNNRPAVSYDLLSINSGSTPTTADVPGAEEFSTPVKPISEFLEHWQHIRERLEERNRPAKFCFVGGGAGSVELILAAHHALNGSPSSSSNSDPHTFSLVTAEQDILTSHPLSVATKFRRCLKSRAIDVQTDARIVKVQNKIAVAADGRHFEFNELLWVTHAGAPSWLAECGLEVDEHGFLLIDDNLRSVSHPDIFGAGDVATMRNNARPKAGVFAVRQARPLTKNLRRSLLKQPLVRHRPQRRFLTLISTGNNYAVASRGSWSTEGAWVWRWKNRIDRRFMRRFQTLPEMADRPPAPLPNALISQEIEELTVDPMRCGGCGAKVGADVLNLALADLKTLTRDDVVVGLNEPDDAALVTVPVDKFSVLSVDAFRPMTLDPFTFGKIAANHCLGDIYAMGAAPQTAMTITSLPVWPQDKLVDELRQMLLGALEVFNAAGAALVGGHTSEGAEVTLGFSITGLIDRDQVLHKATLVEGDALILTKPVGTGTVMAADMRGKASGIWVEAAYESMLLSNQQAGEILRSHGASACTDITGFGLAGHLLEMLGTSNLSASLDLSKLPILTGAVQTLEAGITSSLQDKNERLSRRVADAASWQTDARFPLLFDPQTAGGLLAGLPAMKAQVCVDTLRENGYPEATVIGRINRADNPEKTISIFSS
jgi:selenide, water dikinase